ncbi:MAG: hypothetical protein ACE5JH_04865 [Acidobacteriota bacterium]
MGLENLLHQAVLEGRLREPFSAAEAAAALASGDWTTGRVHSFLLRHCSGNLAAREVLFERASRGRYRLMGPQHRSTARGPAPGWRRLPRSAIRRRDVPPGEARR